MERYHHNKRYQSKTLRLIYLTVTWIDIFRVTCIA